MLTPRQEQVAELLKQGYSDKEIAARLGVSPRTASRHVDGILRRLGVDNRVQAAVAIYRRTA